MTRTERRVEGVIDLLRRGYVEQAIKDLENLHPPRIRRKVRQSRVEKRATKEERRERVAELRETVFRLAAGRCEACACEAPWDLGHLHHLLSGGLRRFREDASTTVWICGVCHDRAHRNDALTFERILALGRLSVTARAAVERRLAKVAAQHPGRSLETGAGKEG